MQKQLLLFPLILAFGFLLLSSYSEGPFNYGAGNRTGSAGSGVGCSASSTCHSTTNLNAQLHIQLFDSLNNSVINYRPGSTYRVLLREIAPGNTRSHFGFQASIVKAADGSTQAGNLSIGSTPNIAVYNAPPQLVEHTQALAGAAAGANYMDTVSFQWTAPAAGFGKVRIYAVLNAVNFDGTSSGDAWVDTTADFDPIPLAVHSQALSSWSLAPNPAQERLHIETTEGPANIIIRDALGRLLLRSRTNAAGNAQVDVRSLPSGTYFICLEARSGFLFKTFQKE
ncbi:MAG: T9SS type A sorting domain-containing protein [Bacteroidetes bacterium]|nr:T9SS type A sorting domain-containing protein [Bacteroidota bacterium]